MNSIDPFQNFTEKFSAGDLTGKFKNAWTEEAFDLETNEHGRWGLSHTKNYVGTSLSKHRLKIFLAIMAFGIFLIFAVDGIVFSQQNSDFF